jgi:hypothetical protein
LPALRQESTSPGEGGRVPEGICIGDPARIIEVVKKWEAVGVDRINFLLNAVETVPQQDVLASLRLFAREVMPRFQPAAATAAGGS